MINAPLQQQDIPLVLTNTEILEKLDSLQRELDETKAELRAEVAEFDENIPWDEREEHMKKERDDEISRVEQELTLLDKEVRFHSSILYNLLLSLDDV